LAENFPEGREGGNGKQDRKIAKETENSTTSIKPFPSGGGGNRKD